DDLTDAAFSELAGQPGWRCYNTGDEGFLDTQGQLHVTGRSSARLKIRGHSVYPAEVEAGIDSLNLASEVAVFSDATRANSLLAALAGVKPELQSSASVHALLDQVLPSYMLPQQYLFLDELPKTATGKIDRRALAELPLTTVSTARASEWPVLNSRERDIAACFQTLLPNQTIDRDTDFFALGGDSLSFAGLHTLLETRYGIAIEQEQLLDNASVGAIAILLDELLAATQQSVDPRSLLVPVRTHGAKTPLFLVHGADGNAYVSPHFVSLLGNDRPFYTFRARGFDGYDRPQRRVEAMASTYIALMRETQARGPYLVGGICAGGIVAVEIARQLQAAGDEVLPLLLIDPPVGSITLRGNQLLHTLKAHARYVKGRLSLRLNPYDQQLVKRHSTLQWLAERGALDDIPQDPRFVATAVHVKQCIRLAIARYTLPDFSGDIVMIASRNRLKAGTPQRFTSGRLHLHAVAKKHIGVLDPHNKKFARALKKSLALADTAVAATEPA
ncbi:MAG: alpha/beta fold hydrolase, partial [Pseudomonadota bacterium]